MLLLSYSRQKLLLSTVVAAAVGGGLLWYLAPQFADPWTLFHSGLAGKFALTFAAFGLGLSAYGFATAIRAMSALDAIRAGAGGLAVTTLFGTTTIAWPAMRDVRLVRHPKSRELQFLFTYVDDDKVAQLTLHLRLTAEPDGGFAKLPARIEAARVAGGRPALRVSQPGAAPVAAAGGFGRRNV